ncbi:MAG: Hpt domain-containing protein [Pseudomonadota bacterium]
MDDLIDWHQVRALHGDVGADMFEEVFTFFELETREILSDLGPATDWRAAMHALKGSAQTVGFAAAAAACAQAEAKAAEGRAGASDVPRITALLEQSHAAFRAGRRAHGI